MKVEVFVGRQPIFNSYEQICAYELLYRSTNMNVFTDVNPDAATVDVIVNAFLNIGIEEVAKGKPCFINFTENLLLGPLTNYLDPRQVVIEILEDVPITEQLIHRVRELKKQGFRIALDDFILDEYVSEHDELFALIDFIKVDFLLSSIEQCIDIERKVKSRFPHICLLAEKVESREQLQIAMESGYELFQGYFFEKPQVIQTTQLPASMIECFQIISLLNVEEPDIGAITEVIERNLSLSYRLLSLMNTYYTLGHSSIKSIKQAILLLGLKELEKWIYLLAMQENMNSKNNEIYVELLYASMFRAKVCEQLAKKTYRVEYAQYFLVGLLSLMDSLLQKPLCEIVDALPLSEVVVATLKSEQTMLTPFLLCSKEMEKMNFEEANRILGTVSEQEISLQDIYHEAYEWANSIVIQEFGCTC